jgi:hypothetical protein
MLYSKIKNQKSQIKNLSWVSKVPFNVVVFVGLVKNVVKN